VVLAAGHQVEPDPEGKTLDVTVMTLLLTPEEAQRAVLASTQGTIHFDLRNGGDVSTIGAPSILLSQLAGRPAAMGHASMRAAAPAAAAKPKSHEIETILGGSSEEGPGKAQDGGAGQ
jgi:pilus assembly protein CpaB